MPEAPESPLMGCRHCKLVAAAGHDPAVMYRLPTGPRPMSLYRCRHCDSYWEGTLREMHTLDEAEAALTYPEAFRDGQVRGPSLVVMQETLLSLREHRRRRGTDPLPPLRSPFRSRIDTSSGAVLTAEGTITASTTRTEFLDSPLFDIGSWTNKQDGWYAAQTIRLNLSGANFGASLLFHHEQIDSTSLWMEDSPDRASWDDYTIEKESALNARHQAWLNENVPDWQQKFRWGAIGCGIDTKGGTSSIVISYRDHQRGSC